jgi:hypothetical protein
MPKLQINYNFNNNIINNKTIDIQNNDLNSIQSLCKSIGSRILDRQPLDRRLLDRHPLDRQINF